MMYALKDSEGVLVATVASLDGMDLDGLTVTQVERDDVPELVEAELLVAIEQQRIWAMRDVITLDKDMIYSAKRAEVDRFDATSSTQIALMSDPQLAEDWPFAMAEIAVDDSLTLNDVIEKFRAGANASVPIVANIEARAQLRREAVKAAITAADKRAAFASISAT